jgi:hypothetical protein
VWEEKAQHNEREEWKRRRKISNMGWIGCLQELWKSFLSKAHNWKPGSDQIQNYWLKAFPAAHRHITKKKKT